MQLKVVWNLRLHADPEGPSLIFGGRFLDNTFIERLWRSLKYEEVFTKAYSSVNERNRGLSLSVIRSDKVDFCFTKKCDRMERAIHRVNKNDTSR
jgi:hypothetical protein